MAAIPKRVVFDWENIKTGVQLFSSFSAILVEPQILGMVSMPFLCNGTLLFQGNLPGVFASDNFKYVSCLIPYIVSFLILCEECTEGCMGE